MENNYFIEKIIGDVVNNCKDSGTILISETSSGTYTCTALPDFYLLLNNKEITISDTTNFNGKFVISNVNETNKTFTISTTSGFADETGTYVANFPYYTYEKWTGFTNILQDLTQNISTQRQRFPRLFLRLDISEEWKNFEQYYISNLTLFFVLNTNQTKRADWRIDNTFDYLTIFKQLFLKNLQINEYIRNKDFIKYTLTRRYYNFTQPVEQNKINHCVDVIEINIKDLMLYYQTECLT